MSILCFTITVFLLLRERRNLRGVSALAHGRDPKEKHAAKAKAKSKESEVEGIVGLVWCRKLISYREIFFLKPRSTTGILSRWFLL
mmetsp:Transcript_43231/g.84954  ORF Transcript_43231/g.84954 Transcript_43231/m.84954 type:complete len:86 (-) Transcript_43231:196-453(-)